MPAPPLGTEGRKSGKLLVKPYMIARPWSSPVEIPFRSDFSGPE